MISLERPGEPETWSREAAFSRSLGWVTAPELETLAGKRVAIAGLGGVGGYYAEVLARLGVGRFHLADMDRYEIQNFNRQNGSGVSNLGLPKTDVIGARVHDINPEAQLKVFAQGVLESNRSEFLDGVDLYLDGLDLFALRERIGLFSELERRKIPAVTVAPVGMGAALVVFRPGSMNFSEYFGLRADLSEKENCVRFLAGLAPSLMHARYLVDSGRVDLKGHRAPSTPMGCQLCAGVAGTTALKILLGRGPVRAAPWSHHFDAYLQKSVARYTFLGWRNPLQRLRCRLLRQRV